MTNADKTSCSFTRVEVARISQREDIVQVLKSKHAVPVEVTPTAAVVSELCVPACFPLKLLVKCCLCSGRGERYSTCPSREPVRCRRA